MGCGISWTPACDSNLIAEAPGARRRRASIREIIGRLQPTPRLGRETVPCSFLTDIYLVGSGRTGIGISDFYDCHVYLVDGGDEAALIDAGSGVDIEPFMRNIAAHGIDARPDSHAHPHPRPRRPRRRVGRLAGAAGLPRAGGRRRGLHRGDGRPRGQRAQRGAALRHLPAGLRHAPLSRGSATARRRRGTGWPPCPASHRHAGSQPWFHLPAHDRWTASACSSPAIPSSICPVAGQVGWISLLNAPEPTWTPTGPASDAWRDLRVDVLLPGTSRLLYVQRPAGHRLRGQGIRWPGHSQVGDLDASARQNGGSRN